MTTILNPELAAKQIDELRAQGAKPKEALYLAAAYQKVMLEAGMKMAEDGK